MLLINCVIIILALMLAFVLYKTWLKPKLTDMCILNTNECIEVKYFKKENSALIFVSPTAYTIWYNDGQAFIYGINTGYICADPKYEAAFKISENRKALENYQCILGKNELMKFYSDTEAQYTYIKIKPIDFNVYKLIDVLVERKIILLDK